MDPHTTPGVQRNGGTTVVIEKTEGRLVVTTEVSRISLTPLVSGPLDGRSGVGRVSHPPDGRRSGHDPRRWVESRTQDSQLGKRY